MDQRDFWDHVEGYAGETAAQTLSVLRMYGRWANFPDDWALFDPLLKVRKGRPRKLNYVTKDDYWMILAGQDNRTPIGVRNIAFAMTLSDTGARIAEMVNIELEDVDLNRGVITLRRKYGDWDPTPITAATAENIRIWLETRQKIAKGHTYLFCATGGRTPGEALTPDGARCIVNDIGHAAGIKLSPHDFRRGLAIWLYLEDVPRPKIIEHLGWRDGRMLDLYIRHLVVDEDVRNVLPGNMLEVKRPTAEIVVGAE